MTVLTFSIAAIFPVNAQLTREQLIDSVATAWSSVATLDPSELDFFVEQSVALHDARIARAAKNAALRISDPVAVRVAALRVLYPFVNGRVSYDLPSQISSQNDFLGSGVSGRVWVEGSQPVDSVVINEVATAMLTLGADPNNDVRVRALIVLRDAQAATAPPPTVSYVCGNRFVLRNAGPLPVLVRYEVSGTSEQATYALPAKPTSAPYFESTLNTKHTGSVNLRTPAGALLSSASNNGTTCP